MSEQVNAVANGYVYLKNISGTVIKPITDLSAINMTITNGIAVEQVNGGTIGIRDGYIESCYYTEMVDPSVGPGNVDSAYIEGGTMYTLLGGYTISQDVPGQNPSPYKVPSEQAVRAAIDAYVATGGTDIVPGAGISVAGGSISVAAGDGISAELSTNGGVSVVTGDGLLVNENGVYVNTGNGIQIDNQAVAVKTKTGSVITADTNGVDLSIGDGLTVGVVGTTNADKLVTNNATVEEILTNSRKVVASGTTTTVTDITDRVVEPHDLRGALSVGQAVDVSSAPEPPSDGTISYSPDYLGTITFQFSSPSGLTRGLGFAEFPKFAEHLKYLFIADIKFTSNAVNKIKCDNPLTIPVDGVTPEKNKIVRVAGTSDTATWYVTFYTDANVNYTVEIVNWRQYEVTALTDDAIAYLAQVDNPDAYFRSTDAYSIRNKYLVKQDMVCPFIPTINMENKNLTVGAGLSYRMQYKSDTPTTRVITADTIPTNGYGWDTHLQLFVDANTTVVFQSPLVLMNPLTINAGHNITIKWRNGQALAYVEDTATGYIITELTGTTDGTLYYGLANPVGGSATTGYYLTFSHITDNQVITLDLADTMTVNRSINIIGNGPDTTDITIPNAVFKMANDTELYMTDLGIGNMTQGFDIHSANYIIRINNCLVHDVETADHLWALWNVADTITGSTFYHIYGDPEIPGGSAVYMPNGGSVKNCIFSDIKHKGGTYVYYENKVMTVKDCVFDMGEGADKAAVSTEFGTASISGCTFSQTSNIWLQQSASRLNCAGTNVIGGTVSGGYGRVQCEDGSVIDGNGTGVLYGTAKGLSLSYNHTLKDITITGGNLDTNTYGCISCGGASTSTVVLSGVTITANKINRGSTGAFNVGGSPSVSIVNCYIKGNTCATDVCLDSYLAGVSARITIKDSECGNIGIYGSTVTLDGTNTVGRLRDAGSGSTGYVRLVAGSTVYGKDFISQSEFINMREVRNVISVGSYSGSGDWVVGGTCSVIVGDTTVYPGGFGSYINNNGDNDFNNSVYHVTTETTTGEGSLLYGLETSGATFLVVDSGLTSLSATTTAIMTDKVFGIMTAEGKEIFGGTVSLASGTAISVGVTYRTDGRIDMNNTTISMNSVPTLKGKVNINGKWVINGDSVDIPCSSTTSLRGTGKIQSTTTGSSVPRFRSTDGSVIYVKYFSDLNGVCFRAPVNIDMCTCTIKPIDNSWNDGAFMSGTSTAYYCVFNNNSNGYVHRGTTFTATNCTFNGSGCATICGGGTITFTKCTFNGTGRVAGAFNAAYVVIDGCTIGTGNSIEIEGGTNYKNQTIVFKGNTILKSRLWYANGVTSNTTAKVLIIAGSTIDMRGNTNTADSTKSPYTIWSPSSIAVGTISNGTFVTGGTATIIPAEGAAFAVKDTGTYIDKDGSTNMTKITL